MEPLGTEEEFHKTLDKMHGATGRHGPFAYALVRWLEPNICLETGTWGGVTTAYIAQALKDNNKGHLTTIDDESGVGMDRPMPLSEVRANLETMGLAGRVTIIKGDSTQVGYPKNIDFAFIDGGHSYEVCSADSKKALAEKPRCICWHDSHNEMGVIRYIAEFKAENPEYQMLEVDYDFGLAVAILKFPVRR